MSINRPEPLQWKLDFVFNFSTNKTRTQWKKKFRLINKKSAEFLYPLTDLAIPK